MSSNEILTRVVALLTARFADAQIEGAREAGFADLSMRQFIYLDLIGRLSNPTPTELARALQVSKPTVSVAINHLEEAGYVRKVQSDEDRRSYHLHLSEKGEQFSRAHANVHRAIAQMITTGLDEAEVEQLTRLMGKVLRHLEAG